jgi:hypothetical protein
MNPKLNPAFHKIRSKTSDADPHHFDADPDPAFHFDPDADPNPVRHFRPDPDPAYHIDADPYPEPTFKFYADPCVSDPAPNPDPNQYLKLK